MFQINWAQMEAGNTTERGEDIGRKERKTRTRRTVRENGGTRESDRARAEQCEDVMEKGKKKKRGKIDGWREDERREGEREDRDDVEEESGRREIRGVPMPCAKEMGLREGVSMCVHWMCMCASGQ